MEQESKLRSLTIHEKLELIAIVESGRTVKEVADSYAINRNTLHYILKNKDVIKRNAESRPGLSNCKRMKKTKCPELEKRVLEYMHECRNRNEKLSGSSIKAMALEIAGQLQVEGFSASNGWLFGLFKRHQISISDFNKGIGPSIEPRVVPATEVTDTSYPTYTEALESESYEETENVEEPKPEYEVMNYDGNELFETEVVEEEELPGYKIQMETMEEEIPESDTSWVHWCRMCGVADGTVTVDEEKTEVFQQVFNLTPDDACKICIECNDTLLNVYKVVCRAKAVENMLFEIQERSSQEVLTLENIVEIRRDFGLDLSVFEISTEDEIQNETEEALEETEGFEEVLYESYEDGMNEESVKEEVEEEFVAVIEDIENVEQDSGFVFKCHLCDVEPFQFMHSLTIHTRQEHQSLPKVACTCGRYLSTWEGLMSHKRKHNSEQKIFKCEICDASFATKAGLSIHVKFKHEKPSKSNICPTCNREFKDASILKTHMRTHLPDEEKYAFECEICGKRMANKWSVKYHIASIHEQHKPHCCHICNRSFGNKSNLRSHLISHSVENVTCDICGNRFKNRISLQSHRKLHKPENCKNFSCEKCGKSFFNRTHLGRHMAAHSEERRYKCPFESCSSEYKWQKDLNNHLATVHSDEKFNKSRLEKQKLRAHPKAFEVQYNTKSRFEKINAEEILIEETEVVE